MISSLIIKLLIIGFVIASGIALIYPDDLIQLSKGSTLQENTEQGISNLKNTSFGEVGNTLTQNLQKITSTIEKTFNKIFDST